MDKIRTKYIRGTDQVKEFDKVREVRLRCFRYLQMRGSEHGAGRQEEKKEDHMNGHGYSKGGHAESWCEMKTDDPPG